LSFRINQNFNALGVQSDLNRISGRVDNSIQRLSSGLKINSAKDNPSGFVTSESLRNRLSSLSEASRTTQDGINLAKVADSNLSEVNRLLNTMRSLAISAGNSATLDGSQYAALQGELDAARKGIDRVATTTRWADKRLLDGTSGVSPAITNSGLANQIYFKGTTQNVPLSAGLVTLTQTVNATQNQLINDKPFAAPTDFPTAGTFSLNGYTFTANGTTDTVQNLLDQMNAVSPNTGVEATLVGVPGAQTIQLQSLKYGTKFPVNFTDPAGVLNTTSSPTMTVVGTDAITSVDVTTEQGLRTIVFTGGTNPTDDGLTLTDGDGNLISLTPGGNGSAALAAGAQIATVTTGYAARIQTGAETTDAAMLTFPDVRSSKLGIGAAGIKTLADIDLTTTGGPTEALALIDQAINQLGSIRANIGSFQKHALESNARTLQSYQENLASTESQIRDTDVAAEMTEYTRNQVMQQSALSILGQANQMPQQILSLLRQ
jgi:flagellin